MHIEEAYMKTYLRFIVRLIHVGVWVGFGKSHVTCRYVVLW